MAFKIPKIPQGSVVIIDWFDANRDGDKYGDANEVMADATCELSDVGFYVGAKGKYVTIAEERGRVEVNHFRHVHHIPKVNIISIRVLQDGEEQRDGPEDSERVHKAAKGSGDSGNNVCEGADGNAAKVAT